MRLAFIAFLAVAGSLAAQDSSSEINERILEAIGPVRGMRYAANWHPPGEAKAWAMDCSNASRWIGRQVFGLNLPRTASDQYLFFRERGTFRKASRDSARLARTLRPGDYLFWKDTYRPKRKPPVTHVMVYLGRDAQGTMWMAGSQGSKGVEVYRFRPELAYGGYRWFLFFKRTGQFIGFARPAFASAGA